jgi:hypothetical protein
LVFALFASGVCVVASWGVAGAAANKTVQVSGSGEVHCPGGTQQDADIFFTAFKQKGLVFSQQAAVISGATTTKLFFITAGTMNANSFTLEGPVVQDTCGGIAQDTQVNASVSGQCGTNVLVTYSDANGETGSFLSNVACT